MPRRTVLATMLLFAFNVFAESYDDYSYSDSNLDARDLSTIQKLDALDKRQVSAQAVLPGQVVFSYGSGIPTVVCALFEITDISMEKGERVFTVQLGDSTRWLIDSAVSGSGADRTEHIVVKALDNGLKTSLIITTNRRTYHIALKSSQKDFMPAVSFNYPGTSLKLNPSYYDVEESSRRFDYSLASSQRGTSDFSTVSYQYEPTDATRSAGERRNYAYSVEGDDSILPLNAFDDGVNTYIQLPPDLHTEDLPTVFRVTEEGLPFFGEEKTALLNFRVEDHTFVIDGIYEHLRLVSGSDSNSIYADIIKES
ncbi:P-type conjugative transfer protein TrbG [Succinivibrio dextrinosolvens]|uniref:P-type conjugative transfer protein TrbG n=1 Tax=Succinivibrio dextrinosolvens TaxID=83771 RepID=UPI001923B9AD|nr:P-type conjugative transfer protein TrbG [Succinivibrio dextrinosolvens]